ncbi:hypothetical protein VNO78_32249 [Psophocarpus tetragonolobus]|uniref:Uncharacterized protein n=1 Tax=Psophocarpus tetragonolobus TaxID=3891 RepID=A0AAN9NV92_PSOTE
MIDCNSLRRFFKVYLDVLRAAFFNIGLILFAPPCVTPAPTFNIFTADKDGVLDNANRRADVENASQGGERVGNVETEPLEAAILSLSSMFRSEFLKLISVIFVHK